MCFESDSLTRSGDPQRHFYWMARHGVDGAFLQRFLGECDVEQGSSGTRRLRDEVTDRVREAAEKEGRVWAIMYVLVVHIPTTIVHQTTRYDVTSVAPDRIERVIRQDWAHLVQEKAILDSPNYLSEKGKPVIAIWGTTVSF